MAADIGRPASPRGLSSIVRDRIPPAPLFALIITPSLLLSGLLGVVSPPAIASELVSGGPAPPKNVTYQSSVDRFPLSYWEWLPRGFSNASSYPLAVYLHGLNAVESAWVRGGFPTDLNAYTAWGKKVIAAAQSQGFILIALNTRTSDGFYIDSKYSGPQEQDVLDAIGYEMANRHISAVYLFGSSMGSIGAGSIAANHPGLASGIGRIADCVDMFQAVEWRVLTKDYSALRATMTITGGRLGSNSSYAVGLFYHDSASRFYPQNYSGVRVYVVAGGNDKKCPNNLNLYGYQQANNTVLNSSCLVATRQNEPTGCTTPLAQLSASNPTAFPWRFDYEPRGGHSILQLNALDMFLFWLGKVPTGAYCGKQGAPPVACS